MKADMTKADRLVDDAYGPTDAIIDALGTHDGSVEALAEPLADESGVDIDEIYDEIHFRLEGYPVDTTCGAMADAGVLDLYGYDGEPIDEGERAELRLRIDADGCRWRVMIPQAPGGDLMRVDTVSWSDGARLLEIASV